MIPEATTLPRSRFFWPGLLVALPLLVLAALAAAGLRSRWQARMAEAREEAQRTVDRINREAAAVLTKAAAKAQPVVLYPAQPVPPAEPSAAWREAVAASGAASPVESDLSDTSDQSDRSDTSSPPGAPPVGSPAASPAERTAHHAALVASFRTLRDDAAPAWTDAGLPVAALAAWEVFQREPGTEAAAALVRTAVVSHPSAISPVILERAAALAEQRGLHLPELSDAGAAWRASEALRAVALRHPDKSTAGSSVSSVSLSSTTAAGAIAAAEGEWIADHGQLWFFLRNGDQLLMAAPGPDWDQLRARASFPPWMAVSVWKDGQPLNGRPLASTASVKFLAGYPVGAEAGADGAVLAESRGPVSVRAALADAGVLYAPLRTEIAWAAALIGAATFAAGGGLWLSRRALRREERLHALKSQFVASVSHELRAPIGSVRLMAEALAAGTVKGAAAQSFHHLLVQEGVRLSALIENVLDFARMESGRRFYQFAETDIAALLRDTAALLEPRAAPRGIRLQLDLQPLPHVPEVDALAIQQAVMNLLDNALKFSPDHSTIQISLSADERGFGSGPVRGGDRHWSIAIADEGPGIPPAEHRRIFERFHRLGNELRRETQGTGIGLSLVKHIAEGHGGRVIVENRAAGGCLFTLRLPVEGELMVEG